MLACAVATRPFFKLSAAHLLRSCQGASMRPFTSFLPNYPWKCGEHFEHISLETMHKLHQIFSPASNGTIWFNDIQWHKRNVDNVNRSYFYWHNMGRIPEKFNNIQPRHQENTNNHVDTLKDFPFQHDSDIVTPYGKWAYYNSSVRYFMFWISV